MARHVMREDTSRNASLVLMTATLFLMGAPALRAQVAAQRDSAAVRGIQDNSFLIEESYNQERGVVQHISVFQIDHRSGAYTFQFTQEWPLPDVRHQLSYSVPIVRPSKEAHPGIGDIHLNYRYQLVGDGNATIAVSPRISALLPTGDFRKERGAGAAGFEAWLPASVVVSREIVVHLNLGLTILPQARAPSGARATTQNWTTGGSVVWLLRPLFNVLIEATYQSVADVLDTGDTSRSSVLTISPGFRWAWNFPSGLQVVPGLALPLTHLSPSGWERALLFYLSFEHPFTRSKPRTP